MNYFREECLLCCMWIGIIVGLVGWQISCADEQAQRQQWQDCAGVYHEECRDVANFQACEYEYYKECINVKPTS